MSLRLLVNFYFQWFLKSTFLTIASLVSGHGFSLALAVFLLSLQSAESLFFSASGTKLGTVSSRLGLEAPRCNTNLQNQKKIQTYINGLSVKQVGQPNHFSVL